MTIHQGELGPTSASPVTIRSIGPLSELVVGMARDGWGPKLPVQLATTSDADVLVVVDADGTPVAAVGRACPHRHCDLAVHGRVVDGTVECKHKGYAWNATSGSVTESATDVPPLALGRVDIVDGELYTDLPAEPANLAVG